MRFVGPIGPLRCVDGPWLVPPIDALSCIVAHGSADARGVAFDYDLRASAASERHVSAVIGYRGGGEDANMVAVLLPPMREAATVTLWVHEGMSWTQRGSGLADGLPLAARLVATIDDGHIAVAVDGKPVARIPTGSLRCTGDFGVRWCRARVKDVALA